MHLEHERWRDEVPHRELPEGTHPHRHPDKHNAHAPRTWNTKNGAMRCSFMSSEKAGSGTSTTLGPKRSKAASCLASLPCPDALL